MKKAKQFILASVILGGFFFLFGPEVIPDPPTNALVGGQEFLEAAEKSDVIIVFNSGGWGDTPFKEAKDFAPIIKEIQKTLQERGYNSIVVPYQRTKNTLSGKIASAKDFLNSFSSSSDAMAKDLEFLAESLPDKKIIVAGLSNGAGFVEKTMEKISKEAKGSVYGITAGTPFWYTINEAENILRLNNGEKDALSKGEAKALLFSLVKTPFRWISSKIRGLNLPFALAFRAPGHQYLWISPEVGPKIATFLEEKLR